MITDVALITTRDFLGPEGLGIHRDDLTLATALGELGLNVDIRAWDDPVDWARVGLVVIRTPWDYCARLEEFLSWARGVDQVTRLRNPLAVMEWNIHKRYLLELRAGGVPIVPTVLVARSAGAAEQAAVLADHGGEVVIKPAVSMGAVGAMRVRADSPAASAHLAALAGHGDVLVQPLVPSVLDAGETSLIYLGGAYSHAVRKVAALGDYRVQDDHGGTVHTHRAEADEAAVATAALACVPDGLAYARVDLVRHHGVPVVMEVELIEPELFLPFDPAAPRRLATHLAGLLPDRSDADQPRRGAAPVRPSDLLGEEVDGGPDADHADHLAKPVGGDVSG